METIVLPSEWHSFCISINVDLKKATVFHNGHIQAVQLFEEPEDDTDPHSKFMTTGHLGGAKFIGIIFDFEMFGTPLPEQSLIEWTLCKSKVMFIGYSFFFLMINNISNWKSKS